MGTCLTISKLVGIGSLGIPTANYIYSAEVVIPKILKGDVTSDESKKQITSLIVRARGLFWGAGSLASFLFYESFKCAPPELKHPYLIYSALIVPIGLLYNYYNLYDTEQALVDSSEGKPLTEYKTVKKTVAEPAEEESSPLDNSSYGDLGKPQTKEKVVEEKVPVEVPAKVLTADETKAKLLELKKGYLYSGAIVGLGFLLSLVGYLGEYPPPPPQF